MTISEYVGKQIKKHRKRNGLTIEQFSQKIGKSKATISKYENGAISIDIETLQEIADALEVEISMLVDYQSPNTKPAKLPENIYFNKPFAYMYYFDGRTRKITRSLMKFYQKEDNQSHLDVIMYHGLSSFDDPEKCQHLFTGKAYPYDVITHFIMTNQVNPSEKMYICMMNPTHANSQAVGIVSGLGTLPFFAPISIKAMISKEILEENDRFMEVIKLSKEDLRQARHYNMMVINRQSSLFLDEK
jgi:transcriptional regulator with XRE-family HTH domain